ncbi:MAG TPA: peptidylprolyl isomerase [Steroidobacteraceae bacterium]|jgi:peptidyl-prolyl cis-trans isomerase C|nr:peptidylprolyl isomerase [Steroidobacteraceae bacterium]
MNHSRLALLLPALAALAACQPKTAGIAVNDNSPPVATVNGVPITRNFYDFYIKGVTGGKSPADITADQRNLALDNLIRAQVVAEQAIKDGVDKNGDAAYMLQLARLNVLEQAVQERYLKDRQPTEQELRAEYETQLAAMPKTEYHARHILVATEPFAQKIIERLDKGEKFDALAKSESMDSSKSNGGDLGWFTPGRMVPEFAGAVMALKPGEYTHKPVQTQYGWHVIQLLETREVTPPPFEQVRQRLVQVVQAKKFRVYQDELLRNAKVEKFLDKTTGPAPAAGAAPAAPTAPAPGASAPNAPAAAAPPAAPGATATPPPATPTPAPPTNTPKKD